MAKTAYRVPEGCRLTDAKVISSNNLVKASELGYKDKERNIFRCAGSTFSGEPCTAKVYLYIKEHPAHNHFAVGSSDKSNHIKGCSAEKKSPVREKKHMDLTGKNTSPEQLFQSFEKMVRNDERKTPLRIDNEQESTEEKEKSVDDDRPVVPKSEDPQNVKELFELLSKLKPDDQYMKNLVREQFMSPQSMDNMIENPLRTDYIMMVGQRTMPKVILNAFGLAVAFHHNKSQFRNPAYLAISFQTREEEEYIIKKMILDNKKDGDRFAIYGQWRKELIGDYMVFRCEPITHGHVHKFQESQYPDLHS